MATQNEKIKAYLEEGHSLTPIDALNLFGCFRLATRIFDLKKQGMKIRTDIVENKATGKRYASYRLETGAEVMPVLGSSVSTTQPYQDGELF